MIAYKIKNVNGHLMFNRPTKIRHSDKNKRRDAKLNRLINRNSRYWLG